MQAGLHLFDETSPGRVPRFGRGRDEEQLGEVRFDRPRHGARTLTIDQDRIDKIEHESRRLGTGRAPRLRVVGGELGAVGQDQDPLPRDVIPHRDPWHPDGAAGLAHRLEPVLTETIAIAGHEKEVQVDIAGPVVSITDDPGEILGRIAGTTGGAVERRRS